MIKALAWVGSIIATGIAFTYTVLDMLNYDINVTDGPIAWLVLGIVLWNLQKEKNDGKNE